MVQEVCSLPWGSHNRWRLRLVVESANRVPVLVQGPECVAEDMVGVVLLLELDETVPVFAEAFRSTVEGFVTAQQLNRLVKLK